MRRYDYIRITPAYSDGVILGVNGVADAALAVEGPTCVFSKTSAVCHNHDHHSTLFRPDGRDRVGLTDSRPTAVLGRTEHVETLARAMIEELRPGVMLMLSYTVPAAAGFDMAGVVSRLRAGTDVPVLEVPARTLEGDWLEGWEAVLSALVETLSVAGPLDEQAVAVVGHFLTRNEGDDQGNVAALKTLLNDLGLEVATVWLDGGRVSDYGAAAHCGWVVSLPHGRKVAADLAARTGARLIVADLPLGLDGTARFLRTVGEATDRQVEARRAIERGLARVVPRLRAVLSLLGDDLAVAILSDPFLARAMKVAFEEVGLRVPLTGILAGWPRFSAQELGEGRVLEDPSVFDWVEAVGQAAEEGVRLVVGSGYAEFSAYKARVGLLEASYPLRLTHFMAPRPSLGFDGFLDLMDRVTNAWHHAHAWRLMDEQARKEP